MKLPSLQNEARKLNFHWLCCIAAGCTLPFTIHAQEVLPQSTIDFHALLDNLERLAVIRCEVGDDSGLFLFERQGDDLIPTPLRSEDEEVIKFRKGRITYISDDVIWVIDPPKFFVIDGEEAATGKCEDIGTRITEEIYWLLSNESSKVGNQVD